MVNGIVHKFQQMPFYNVCWILAYLLLVLWVFWSTAHKYLPIVPEVMWLTSVMCDSFALQKRIVLTAGRALFSRCGLCLFWLAFDRNVHAAKSLHEQWEAKGISPCTCSERWWSPCRLLGVAWELSFNEILTEWKHRCLFYGEIISLCFPWRPLPQLKVPPTFPLDSSLDN